MALADYGRCGYRFLTERVIGLGPESTAAAPEAGGAAADPGGGEREWDERPGARPAETAPSRPRARQARMGFGRAVHELLEWSARNDWALPEASARAVALAREGASAEADARLVEMLEGWLGSPLLAEMRGSGETFRPEVPFRLALGAGTVLRGTIDLLCGGSPGGEVTVVDYKTDRLGGRAPELDAGYLIQRDLYAAAVAAATGAESVRSAYVFLERPGEPVVAQLGPEEIAAGRERVEALVARIREGHFEATSHPHRDLCHDCPARRRLCPHDREVTDRASAEPPVEPAPAGAVAAPEGPA